MAKIYSSCPLAGVYGKNREFKGGEAHSFLNNLSHLLIRGCLVVIARHEVPKQSLKAIVRLLGGACPERHEILRYAQNDTKRRARNDSLSW